AMKNSLAVRVCCRSRHLCQDRHALPGIAPKRVSDFVHASASRELHAKVREAFFAFAYFVDRKNVRMIETRGCFCFATEPLQRFVGIRMITENAFHGHDTSGVPLARAIDNTHAAASDFFQDLVIPEPPFLVGNIDPGEQALERFSCAIGALVIETGVQKAIYAKPVSQ